MVARRLRKEASIPFSIVSHNIQSCSKKGALEVSIHERSKLQSGSVRKCTAKRFSDIKFEMPEPEEKPEDAAEDKKDDEPEPRPLVEVFYELETPPVEEGEDEDEE